MLRQEDETLTAEVAFSHGFFTYQMANELSGCKLYHGCDYCAVVTYKLTKTNNAVNAVLHKIDGVKREIIEGDQVSSGVYER